MRSRIAFAAAFAASAFFTFASVALADDKVKVGVGTFVVAAVWMTFLGIVYLAKLYFGLAGNPPPPPPADDGHGHAAH